MKFSLLILLFLFGSTSNASTSHSFGAPVNRKSESSSVSGSITQLFRTTRDRRLLKDQADALKIVGGAHGASLVDPGLLLDPKTGQKEDFSMPWEFTSVLLLIGFVPGLPTVMLSGESAGEGLAVALGSAITVTPLLLGHIARIAYKLRMSATIDSYRNIFWKLVGETDSIENIRGNGLLKETVDVVQKINQTSKRYAKGVDDLARITIIQETELNPSGLLVLSLARFIEAVKPSERLKYLEDLENIVHTKRLSIDDRVVQYLSNLIEYYRPVTI